MVRETQTERAVGREGERERESEGERYKALVVATCWLRAKSRAENR